MNSMVIFPWKMVNIRYNGETPPFKVKSVVTPLPRVNPSRSGHGFFSGSGNKEKNNLLEVSTIYKAYFSDLCFREYPNKIWSYMVQTYLHFRILKFP